MKWWLALFILPIVTAAGIDQALTTVTLKENADITSEYIIVSEAVETIKFSVPLDVNTIDVRMDGKKRTCKIQPGEKHKTANCGSTIAGKHVLTVKYKSSSVLGKVGSGSLFRDSIQLPFKTEEYSYVLKLPVGTIIPREEGKDPTFYISPTPDEIISDGQRIIINWKEEEIASFSASTHFQPVNRSGKPILAGIILGGAAGITTALYAIRKRKKPAKKTKRKKQAKRIIQPTLIESEQRIVNLLKESADKELWQKQLQAESGFSKAKLSRTIRNLESRGVVIRTPYGNSNKIALREK